MRYQLAGAGDTTGPAKAGVIDQAASLLFKQLIEGQSRIGLSRVSCGKSLIMLPQVSAMDCAAGV